MDDEDYDVDAEHGENAAPNLMESKAAQLDDFLNEKLEEAFHQPMSQVLLREVAKIASEYHPIDLARAVTRLPVSVRSGVYCNLPDLEAKIAFIINAGSSTRTAVFRRIDDEEIIKLLEVMPPDEAVDVVEDMSSRRLRRVLELLDREKALRIREILQHSPHTAGRLMTNEFFAFPLDTTLGEVAREIRNHPGIDFWHWIFVLNEDEELVGFVPSRTVIINPKNLPLRQVMQSIHYKVAPESTRDEVVDLVERYKIPALPVVDKDNTLVGVIGYEDVVEVMEDITDETIASIAGTAEDVSEHEPTVKRFVWRAPWLIVTLCAGLTTATAMSYFRGRTWWFSFVPFFVPLIAGMSGNVGIQCSTHIVRAISTGELSKGSRREAVFNEIFIGLLTGLSFGLFCGLLVFVLNQYVMETAGITSLAMALIVSCGVLGASVTASCLGACSPLVFSKLQIDPAAAAGPIVTAFNDVSATLMFFFVTWMVSSLLF